MSSPLDVLLADGVIDEILGRLKSGKEADISLVSQRGQILAAKVYKDRATRSFKNNADYKEGRKTRNTRTQRAMDSGGRFGRDAAEEAWKSAESTALSRLVAAGVRVPKPVIFYEGVLLMELVLGDDGQAAPRLIDVALDPAAAATIFLDLRGQIITMLSCDLIHGDLSPYNILAAAGGPTIIDFPQVISAAHSSRALFFFQRDFDNVLRYVAGFDPTLMRFAGDAHAIWRAYTGRFLTPDFVPPPPLPPRPPRRDEPRRDNRPFEPRRDGRDVRPPDHRPPEARRDARDVRPPDHRPQEPRRPGGDARRAPEPRRPGGDVRRPDNRPQEPRRPGGDVRHPDSRSQEPRRPPSDVRQPDNRSQEPRRPFHDVRHPDNRPPAPRQPEARPPELRRPPPPPRAARYSDQPPPSSLAEGPRPSNGPRRRRPRRRG